MVPRSCYSRHSFWNEVFVLKFIINVILIIFIVERNWIPYEPYSLPCHPIVGDTNINHPNKENYYDKFTYPIAH